MYERKLCRQTEAAHQRLLLPQYKSLRFIPSLRLPFIIRLHVELVQNPRHDKLHFVHGHTLAHAVPRPEPKRVETLAIISLVKRVTEPTLGDEAVWVAEVAWAMVRGKVVDRDARAGGHWLVGQPLTRRRVGYNARNAHRYGGEESEGFLNA